MKGVGRVEQNERYAECSQCRCSLLEQNLLDTECRRPEIVRVRTVGTGKGHDQRTLSSGAFEQFPQFALDLLNEVLSVRLLREQIAVQHQVHSEAVVVDQPCAVDTEQWQGNVRNE